MVRKLRQAKPVAKTAVKAIKPKSSGKRKGDDDEDSIDDSGSELGWDSEEDQTFRHDEEDYDDEDEEGGILLSDMIGRAPTKAPVQSTKAKKRPIEVDSEVDEEVENDEEMDEDEDVNTSDADDVDEEEEGEGDDQEDDDEGEEEGSGDDMFNALSDGEDEEGFSGEDDYDSTEDGDHDQLVATITNKLAAPTAAKSKLSAFSSMPESQTYATGGKVTLHALMDAIDDTRGISAVKAQLTSLDTSKGAPMYMDKVTAERIERTAAYAGRSADMEKWQDTVLTNRAAAQLDLANDKKYVPTYRSLVRKFSPRSAFEKEVAMVVTSRPKAEETNALRAEAAALAARHADISMEEIQQKQADLAKVNKLMFYEQMKRHRINKIKSKAFRAIARKGRKRAQGQAQGQGQEEGEEEVDEEDLAELRDANAHARVKERMDLKHSNTSKWAKMALAHGHANKSLRDAYHEQVRLGQQLTEKMHEEVGGGADGEAEGDYDASSGIAAQSRAEVSDYLKALDAAPEAEAGGKFGKLFAMDFMQKAAAKQKEEAKETARALLKEIEQMERQADGDDDDDSDREAEGRGPKVSVQQSAQRALERKAAAEEVASMMTMSAGMRLQPRSTSQGVQKEEAAAASNPWLSAARPSAASTPKVVAVAVPLPSAAASGETKTKGKGKTKAADKEKGAKAVDSHQGKRTAAASSSGTSSGVPPSAAVDSAEAPAAPSAKPAAASSSKAALSLTHRSQAELVAAAFAGPDYAADFAASKAQQVDDELGIKAKQMAVLKNVKAGWGDWAGPGAMEVSPRILAIRDRAMLKVQKENDVQRLQRKDFHKQTVILSERRSKAAAKYKVVDVPYPFTCREDYERSLQMPLGEEWNAMHVVSKMTEPEVKTRSGRIIEPIALAKGKVSELAQQKQSLPKGNKHKGKKQRTG